MMHEDMKSGIAVLGLNRTRAVFELRHGATARQLCVHEHACLRIITLTCARGGVLGVVLDISGRR